METKNTSIYYSKLELENIRSFGGRQCLSLLDEEGRPARWTLILGDNGVGKTTLLQCLVRMRPLYGKAPDVEDDEPSPNPIESELYREADDSVLKWLTRSDTDKNATICAELITGENLNGSEVQEKHSIMTSIKISRSEENIKDVVQSATYDGKKPEFDDSYVDPLVLAYGAGRHMGGNNLESWAGISPIASLFDASVELLDAEEMLWQLDYFHLKERPNAKTQLDRVIALLVEILPALKNPDDINIRGPRLSGSIGKDRGVWVNTPSGLTPFTQLSLGYQTVVAWTADIAWRMLNHYTECDNPLLEPAIVVVDEIDLHLHPHWQRTIRKHLTQHFPAIQFITTAHSPLMAQDALDTNLIVIHDEEGQAVIESEPTVIKSWRLDQILTSELFGIESARPVQVEKNINRRILLAQKQNRTEAEQNELDELDKLVVDLPTAESAEDQSAMDIVRKAAKLLKK